MNKTIFDAKKVTYNTYLCAISDMSREMMERMVEIEPNVKTGNRKIKGSFLEKLSHKKTR